MRTNPFASPFIRIACLFPLILLGSSGCGGTPPAGPGVWDVGLLGAAANGAAKDTAIFQNAFDSCAKAGGGIVNVPAGTYLIGSVTMGAKTILHLEQGAIINGSPDMEDYPLTTVRWEGRWVSGHAGLICAYNADEIGIVGDGTINGNPSVGGRLNPRAPVLMEFQNCDGVRLGKFSTTEHGIWSIHPVYCQHFLATNLHIKSTGGNGDGIDIDSCVHAEITNCDIDTGDDCIAIKSGRGMEGLKANRPSEDIVISHCRLGDSNFACIGIGSEISAGAKKIRIEDCTFVHSKTASIYIKSRIGRGSGVEDVVGENLKVIDSTGGFLRINLLNSGLQDSEPVPGEEGIPYARNFKFSNITVSGGKFIEAASISPQKPLDGLVISHVTGVCSGGMNLANMRNVELKDIHITGFDGPELQTSNVTGVGLEGAVPRVAPATSPSGAVN